MSSPRLLVVVLSVCGCLFSVCSFAAAQPGTLSSLPGLESIQGGVSVESAERQLQANLLDYQNDQLKASSIRTSSCRDTKWIRDIYKNGLVPSPAISLPPMPKLLTEQGPDFSAENAQDFVSNSFTGVSLNPTEKSQLQALENHLVSSPPSSPEGAMQILITAQELAISISERIYSDSIETYTLRADAAESVAKLDGVEDECNENTLKVARDQAMSQATQVVLNIYQSYQAASQAALQQSVNSLK
jgi:hypothetical protein